MSQHELMEAISRQVLKQAEEIKGEARERAAAIVRKAEAELDKIGAAVIEKARVSIQVEEAKIINEAKFKARKEVLSAKHKLVERVITGLEQSLAGLPDRKEYKKVVARLLDESLEGVSGPVVIRCRPQDAQIVRDLVAKKEFKATIEERPFPLAGVEVLWGEGFRLIVRNTLKSRMEKIHPDLLQEANRLVFESRES
jgi:vacuolar-type H+-ATPase subunit E/Vma4